jgi:hypothetical protein
LKNGLISVRLFGGLGNQIFQYMAAKWLAEKNDWKLSVDTTWLTDGYTHPNSSISPFRFYAPDFEYGLAHANVSRLYMDRFKTFAARKSSWFATHTRIHSPKRLGYVDLRHIQSECQLRGYYQTPRYFTELLKSEVLNRDCFELTNPSLAFDSTCIELPKNGFIAIHVRGGDYRKKGSPYLELNGDYYKTALGMLTELDPRLPKLVFTDDVPLAKEVLSGIANFDFVNDHLLSAAESVTLMSKASGIVTANSTFSYWAAMMSGSHSTIVSPKHWLKLEHHDEDFIPKVWKTI